MELGKLFTVESVHIWRDFNEIISVTERQTSRDQFNFFSY